MELSARERQVLGLLAAGHTAGEIAAMLRLAEGTISNYVSRAAAKLGARTAAQAVALALIGRAIPAPGRSGPLTVREAIRVERAKSRRR